MKRKVKMRTSHDIMVDKIIGGRIKELRLAKKMSQCKLAEFIGIATYQVTKYERGENSVSVKRILLIANILEVDVSYFFNELISEEDLTSSTDQACLELVTNFMKIKDPAKQELVHKAVKAWSEL